MKAQTAIEFLTTYGWVIFAVLLLLVLLYNYGFFDVMTPLPNQCTFDTGLPCVAYRFQEREWVIAGGLGFPMRLVVQLSNNLGYDIAFSNNTAAIYVENIGKPGKNTYIGNCSPKLPYVIKKGEVFTCTFDIYDRDVVPSIGKKLSFKVELNYTNCLADPYYLVNGSCALGSNYSSKGSIITPMEKTTTLMTLFCGDGFCTGDENPSNCPADCPPPTTLLLTASPKIVTPDGEQFSVITAKVLNRTAEPMANIEVSFISAPIGNLSSYSNVTNSSGEATVLLRSKDGGVAKVTARAVISNETTVTFRAVPVTLLLDAYDRYLGYCGGGSYIIAHVLDAGNKPIKDIEVSFSHNATGIASLSPSPEITDETGLAVSYFTDNKIEKVNISARVDINELDVHLKNSTVVEVVNCQACNAPVKGDWIIDKKVVCEDADITLQGNLNISVEIGYIKKWGDLTFKHVNLKFSGSYNGQRGVYMNRMSRFLISDKDNDPLTTWDSSNITSSSYNHYTFWVKPNADYFEMRNSYISYCGFNVSSIKDRKAYDVVDYRTGLFVSINNSVIEGNTFRGDGISLIGVVLNYSNNNSIQGNVFDSLYTALYLNNSNNNLISNNTVKALLGFSYGYDWTEGTINPSLWLISSSNNTISKNFIDGNSLITAFAGPAIQLDYSSYNQIVENYMEECDDELALFYSDYNNISNNRIREFHFWGIDMIYGADFNTFENNEINASEHSYGFAPLTISDSSNNVFRNNSLRASGCTTGGAEIKLDNSNNNLFSDISIYGSCYTISSYVPTPYYPSRNNTIVWLNTNASGPLASLVTLYLVNAPETKILNSTKIQSIYLQNSGGVSIINNTINPSDLGIYAYRSTANISLNTVGYYQCVGATCSWSCHDRSLYSDSSTLLISNNTFKSFSNYAVYINNTYAPSTEVRIENNTIWSPCSPVYGIYTEQANNLVIKNNTISSARTGINFTYSNFPSNATYNTIGGVTYGIGCYYYTTAPAAVSNTYQGVGSWTCSGCSPCS